MDSDNVIEIDGDINDLEAELLKWQQLPFNLRKLSDSSCVTKYGCTNIQLYHNVKARLLSDDNDEFDEINRVTMRNNIRFENVRSAVSKDNDEYNVIDLSSYSFDSQDYVDEAASNKDLVPICFITSFTGPYDGIIFKNIKHYKFFDVAISFKKDLTPLYYYSLVSEKDMNRMSAISYKDYIGRTATNGVCVSVILVTKDVGKRIRSGVENYMMNQGNNGYASFGYIDNDLKGSKYNVTSDISYEAIITKFINMIFTISKIYPEDSDSDLLSNTQDYNTKSNNIYIIYNGKASKYDAHVAAVKINKMLHIMPYDDLNFFKSRYNKKYLRYTVIEATSNIRCIDNTDPTTATSTPDNTIDPVTVLPNEYNDNSIANKIALADKFMASDSNIVIINDFKDNPNYTLPELEDMYNKFNALSDSYQNLSNTYSVQIWGSSIISMYQAMKNKLLSIQPSADPVDAPVIINPSSTDQGLKGYINQVSSEVEDPVKILTRKIEINNTENANLYESAVLEDFNKSLKYIPHDYKEDIPQITPFLSYDEYVSYTGDDSLTAEEYVTRFDKDPLNSFDNLRQLYRENKTDDLLSLGWNPTIKPTAETMNYARNKQIAWMNENKQVNIIDATKVDFSMLQESADNYTKNQNLSPIFIVLSFTGTPAGIAIRLYGAGKYKYSHACLSLSSDLHKMYTYNMKAPNGDTGFVVEDIDQYVGRLEPAKLKVMCLFVTKRIKEKIDKTVAWYMKNKAKTKYSIENLGRLIARISVESKYSLNMFCSQFVDSVLKIAHLDISGEDSIFVAPEDLGKYTDTTNIYTVFEGNKKDYNSLTIDGIIENLKKNKTYKELDAYKSKADREKEKKNKDNNKKPSTPKINIHDIFNRDKTVKEMTTDLEKYVYEEDESIDEISIIHQLESYLNPVAEISYISEVKTPIGFNKKGDLYVDKTINLQQEYNEAHKLLSMYDSTNEVGIKHELARLFYINSIIEKKLKKMKKDDPQYKELMDLRARVLNDFNTYFKVIQSVDKHFDFMDYLKNSEYYNKTITVDNSTLKFTGMYIKAILKTLIK